MKISIIYTVYYIYVFRAAAGQMGASSRIVLLCPLPQYYEKKTTIGVKIEL